jgi:hypothetical protein
MSLLWRTATDVSLMPGSRHFAPPSEEDERRRDEQHHEHRMHQWLRDAGFGDSPCGYGNCPAYSERHDEMMDKAYFAPKGPIETHAPGSIHLRGYEKVIDPATVIRYMNHPPSKPAHVFSYDGQHHILDGHHRLLADTIAGRPLTFEHTNLDES